MTMKTRKMNALVVMSSNRSSPKPQFPMADRDVGNVGNVGNVSNVSNIGDGFRSFRLKIITLGPVL